MINLKKILIPIAIITVVSLSGVSCQQTGLTKSGLKTQSFDSTINGKKIELITLRNNNDMEVCITNYGARIVSITVPDKDNNLRDVVLGFDNITQYADTVNNPNDFGAILGRYANRINKGQFNIGGKKIQLPQNSYGHCLNGGPSGWQYQVFDIVNIADDTVQLSIVSKDGDNNFPGNVKATVTYTLTNENALDIKFEATTDKETIINMTSQSYFNLSGNPSQPATNMVLYINADTYTPSDTTYMTTGETKSVYGTPMDFRKAHPLYESIADTTYTQIRNADGYDHNWCLNTYKDGKGDDTKVAASLYSPETGIFLQMFTNEPGIQVYTGNFLGTGVKGKNGIVYPKRASVSLGGQKFPDSPNKKKWASPYLKPGEKYFSHVVYKFSVR